MSMSNNTRSHFASFAAYVSRLLYHPNGSHYVLKGTDLRALDPSPG